VETASRWSDDLRRTAARSWMRVVEDRARWREIGEAYVQQWTVVDDDASEEICSHITTKFFFVRSRKLSNVGQLSRAPPCFGRQVKPLVPAAFAVVSTHWAYDPFSLCVIHKAGLCRSSGDINRLMMMIHIYLS
jgi:hypothetical protein